LGFPVGYSVCFLGGPPKVVSLFPPSIFCPLRTLEFGFFFFFFCPPVWGHRPPPPGPVIFPPPLLYVFYARVLDGVFVSFISTVCPVFLFWPPPTGHPPMGWFGPTFFPKPPVFYPPLYPSPPGRSVFHLELRGFPCQPVCPGPLGPPLCFSKNPFKQKSSHD